MALRKTERLKGVHPSLAAVAFDIAKVWELRTGNHIQVIYGYRSHAEQDAIYAQGRTKPGPIATYKKGGDSAHQFYCAIDLWPLTKDGQMDWKNKEIDAVFKNCIANYPDLVWGGIWGKFADRNHIELKDWQKVKAGTLKFEGYKI